MDKIILNIRPQFLRRIQFSRLQRSSSPPSPPCPRRPKALFGNACATARRTEWMWGPWPKTSTLAHQFPKRSRRRNNSSNNSSNRRNSSSNNNNKRHSFSKIFTEKPQTAKQVLGGHSCFSDLTTRYASDFNICVYMYIFTYTSHTMWRNYHVCLTTRKDIPFRHIGICTSYWLIRVKEFQLEIFNI